MRIYGGCCEKVSVIPQQKKMMKKPCYHDLYSSWSLKKLVSYSEDAYQIACLSMQLLLNQLYKRLYKGERHKNISLFSPSIFRIYIYIHTCLYLYSGSIKYRKLRKVNKIETAAFNGFQKI